MKFRPWNKALMHIPVKKDIQNNETEYHNEPYGFSLTIPNDFNENLTINENSMGSEGVKFDFIYSEDYPDGTNVPEYFSQ